MAETIDQVVGQLRGLAVELVRKGRASEAAAVLSGIGAVEMLSQFADGAANSPANGQQQHQDQQHEHFG